MTARIRKAAKIVAIAVPAVLIAMQFVPYGRRHSNPPVVREPAWDRPSTRALARRACFDCHSNETRWPWYSHVAPVSWLVESDVDEGRQQLDFSEWNRVYKQAGEAARDVREGEMPPLYYLPLHPPARLSPEEKLDLERGLTATLGPKD
jgi:hypothetical protein